MFACKRKNSLATLETLLDAGADVNVRDAKGWTAIMHAAAAGNDVAMDRLMDMGADLDSISDSGLTAIMLAVRSKMRAIVHRMIEEGADPSEPDANGETILMSAILNGDIKMFKYLLTRGEATQMNKQDSSGVTVSMLAAARSDLEALKMIAEYGGNFSMKDNIKKTTLMFAVESGSFDVVRFVLGHKNALETIEYTDDTGHTAIDYAERVMGTNRTDLFRYVAGHIPAVGNRWETIKANNVDEVAPDELPTDSFLDQDVETWRTSPFYKHDREALIRSLKETVIKEEENQEEKEEEKEEVEEVFEEEEENMEEKRDAKTEL